MEDQTLYSLHAYDKSTGVLHALYSDSNLPLTNDQYLDTVLPYHIQHSVCGIFNTTGVIVNNIMCNYNFPLVKEKLDLDITSHHSDIHYVVNPIIFSVPGCERQIFLS